MAKSDLNVLILRQRDKLLEACKRAGKLLEELPVQVSKAEEAKLRGIVADLYDVIGFVEQDG